MQTVVHKYGGSSVADLSKLQKVADRIASVRESGVRLVVVVSAMGNTTNELIALAGEVSASPDRRELPCEDLGNAAPGSSTKVSASSWSSSSTSLWTSSLLLFSWRHESKM